MESSSLTPVINSGNNGGKMASRMTILKGRVRLFKSRIGSIFLVVLGIACALCVANWLGSTVLRRDGTAVAGDFEGGGRRLAALPGGEEFMHRHGHRHKGRKRPHQEEEEEAPICQVPKLTLEADTIKEAYYQMEPLHCHEDQLFYLDDKSVLRLNHSVLHRQVIEKCEYRSIERIDDNIVTYSNPHVRKEKFEILVKNDFFRVECYLKNAERDAAYLQGGQFGDYQRRRLLSDEQLVHVPKLTGSVGMPDLPDQVLHNQAKKIQQQAAAASIVAAATAEKNEIKKVLQKQAANQKTDNQNAVIKSDQVIAKAKPPHEEVRLESKDDFDYADIEDYVMYSPDYQQFFAQVHPTSDILERVRSIRENPNRMYVNSTRMNVLMFALDSMSHMSYQRKLPKTYKLLKDNLGAVIMEAYNIVGDATTAALLPILTGKGESELPEARVNKEGTHHVDVFPFVWNKYEQAGYVTLYSEDQPSLGTFQLRLNGFELPPVDHYMRPFWQAALQSMVHEGSPQYCLGGKPEHQYTLDYIRDLFQKYPKDVPKFAFGFIGELSHADNNPAQYIDEDLVELLEFLRDSGHLDNTLLIVMGDHGARYSKVRYTTQGKLEERLPMMSFTFPQSFKEKYPQLYRNLKKNRERLTTPFDLHELLKTVLNIHEAEKPIKYNDRGISLLKEIPRNRTCTSANIDLHWCTCMKYEELNKEDEKIAGVANFVVDYMNKRTSLIRDQCHSLTLRKIREAWMVYPNEKVLKYLKSMDADQRVANFSKTIKLDILHYQITLETEPNDGLYEATIQADVATGTFQIIGEVSRINKYGDQPHCIIGTHPDLRKYCYCKAEPTPKPKPQAVYGKTGVHGKTGAVKHRKQL